MNQNTHEQLAFYCPENVLGHGTTCRNGWPSTEKISPECRCRAWVESQDCIGSPCFITGQPAKDLDCGPCFYKNAPIPGYCKKIGQTVPIMTCPDCGNTGLIPNSWFEHCREFADITPPDCNTCDSWIKTRCNRGEMIPCERCGGA